MGRAGQAPDYGGTALNSEQRELLRRLTLNDETILADVLSGRVPGADGLLDGKTRSLVRLAGLVALDSETASLHAAVDSAHAAGAGDEEILELVMAIAPLVGVSRVSSAVPSIAIALERE